MTEELLKIIKDEANEEIATLDKYNEYADLRNKKAQEEEIKRKLGLPYNPNLAFPRKTETGIIMKAYQKHISEIEENETNEIYVYIATYKPNNVSDYEFDDGAPFDIETDYNDKEATHRSYWNLEGVWSVQLPINECQEFERTHTVLFVDDFYQLQQEFITTAVKENQEKAISKVLKRK